MIKSTALFCALAVGSQAAFAATPINEKRALKADGRLLVSNVSGSIEVEGWDRNEVTVTGSLGDGSEGLDISGDDGDLRIEVRLPRNGRDVEETRLRLRVPRRALLSLEGVSADVSATHLGGRLQANTVSGDLALDVSSEDVRAKTVSGDIQLRGPVKNTSGNSVSGDIDVNGASGKLDLESVSGEIHVMGGAPVSELDLKSVSGDLDVDVALSPQAQVRGETLSGEIKLRVPADSSALVSVKSFSGDINSVFTPAADSDGKHRKRVEYKLGAGSGRVDLSTHSGDVEIERR